MIRPIDESITSNIQIKFWLRNFDIKFDVFSNSSVYGVCHGCQSWMCRVIVMCGDVTVPTFCNELFVYHVFRFWTPADRHATYSHIAMFVGTDKGEKEGNAFETTSPEWNRVFTRMSLVIDKFWLGGGTQIRSRLEWTCAELLIWCRTMIAHCCSLVMDLQLLSRIQIWDLDWKPLSTFSPVVPSHNTRSDTDNLGTGRTVILRLTFTHALMNREWSSRRNMQIAYVRGPTAGVWVHILHRVQSSRSLSMVSPPPYQGSGKEFIS